MKGLKVRFDLFVAKEFNISRNSACELIKNSKVLLDGKVCSKPSLDVLDAKVELLGEIYVSRAALKLKPFLAKLPFSCDDKLALDVGSSSGGFVQILLQNGAKSVVALDIGTLQLHNDLRDDSRVVVKENTDIRNFTYDYKFEIITCDVSFISLCDIIEHIDKNACLNAKILILFKPQFEVGKDAKRNKKGVVVDKKAINLARKKFEIMAAELGWELIQSCECELKGKEGNAEFFYAFNKR